MSEAIFSKYSKSGSINSNNTASFISNSIKATLGLPNSATLDDCLSMLSLRDPNYATIQVTLKDVDGTSLQGHQLRMTQANGTNLTYTTDGAGQCIFKTSSGQATIRDGFTNATWFDISPATQKTIDCPIGTVKQIIMQRSKKLSNGYSYNFGNTNQWANFSKYANKADISIKGHSGQGGTSSVALYAWFQYAWSGNTEYTTSPTSTTGIHCKAWVSYGQQEHNFYMDSNDLGTLNWGGNGQAGVVKNYSSISLTSKNFYINFGNPPSNISRNLSSGHFENTSSSFPIASGFINTMPYVTNGNTGSTISAFGYSCAGGIGGGSRKTADTTPVTSYTGSGIGLGCKNIMVRVNCNMWQGSSSSNRISGEFYVETGNGSYVPGYVWLNNFQYK